MGRVLVCSLWDPGFDTRPVFWLSSLIFATFLCPSGRIRGLYTTASVNIPSSLLFTNLTADLIVWHVEPLLGNDHEKNNDTKSVTRQRPVNSRRGKVFSVRFVPRYCKQYEWVKILLRISRELLLLEAGSWGQRQFRNPEEGERPPLKAATKQRQWRCDGGH
jgi:hypothetical protein